LSTISTTIIDNRDGNTLLTALERMGAGGRELSIASAFFSLDALLLLADSLENYDRIRILFGDDASPRQRQILLEKLRMASDADLLIQREKLPLLSALQKVEALFAGGRVEARCYTANKFHAKAYLIMRPEVYPAQMAVIGSGNLTRPGLLQNLELNVELTPEQTSHLAGWYEDRWNEASEDVVTEDVLSEIRRQIDLYDPYFIYLKALLLWGRYIQGDSTLAEGVDVYDILDPHQQHAYNQALIVLQRCNGVMVCDGVGLGKSFIALALMEKLCREGENVLLVAPKNILDTSWTGYLGKYLDDMLFPFGNIHEIAMTELGFPPEGEDETDAETPEATRKRRKEAHRLWARASVVIVDESHNFRTTSAARYKNLLRITAPYGGRRKKVIMLTATPVNNYYRDIAAQLAFITQDDYAIGGYTTKNIMSFANTLDKDPKKSPEGPQGVLELLDSPEEALSEVLEQVVIQRSRKTCKEQSEAAGRPIMFPERNGPVTVEYAIGGHSPELADLLALAEKRFAPLSYLLKKMKAVSEEVGVEEVPILATPLKGYKGIKLAAFLPEQYSLTPQPGQKAYQTEVRLAALVYANTLKQLESSLPAFQGIIQSLGTGLIARLAFLVKDAATPLIKPHADWVRTPIFERDEAHKLETPEQDLLDDGEALDADGAEVDDWVEKAIVSRRLERKLAGYHEGNFRVEKWRNDIVSDLQYLKEIHEAVLKARASDDPKLERLLPEIAREIDAGRRVLVFTQSQRTAEYLEKTLRNRTSWRAFRIDSRVEKTRAAILHAFCPGYNPAARAASVPEKIDVLISTDVLSEGVNLQEAGAIFSWDIHWNPVRLIQRIGRVDRRLDPKISRDGHSFTIYNVLPPKEIEDIIRLVDTVEGRTLNISRIVGIDMSFFKPDDPSGTLREFNASYEGKSTARDTALGQYVRLVAKPPEDLVPTVEALPPGAFGVWGKAPHDGLFALFTMEPTDAATEADKQKFAQTIGRPVMALEQAGGPVLLEAGAALNILSHTTAGEHSANPSGESDLGQRLAKLKSAVRMQFADISLPRTIMPKLVCWMELRKGDR